MRTHTIVTTFAYLAKFSNMIKTLILEIAALVGRFELTVQIGDLLRGPFEKLLLFLLKKLISLIHPLHWCFYCSIDCASYLA